MVGGTGSMAEERPAAEGSFDPGIKRLKCIPLLPTQMFAAKWSFSAR